MPIPAVPPKLTVAVVAKSVPVIVTSVPPVVGPEFGVTAVTVGGVMKVKQPPQVPVCVSTLLTTTSKVPAACAGVIAVMLVALMTTTLVAALPPKLTVSGPTKSLPVTVTAVPPAVEPLVGATAVAVGGARKVKQPMQVPD